MGTGWRRAFCTSIRRDPEATSSSSTSSKILEKKQQSPSRSSSRSCVKLGIGGIFSGGSSSHPSTPRLHSASSTPRCHRPSTASSSSPLDSPKLQCKTTTAATATAAAAVITTPPSSSSTSILPNSKESPRLSQSSSPRSPSRFALFKTALRLARNRCGICGESVSQRTAVFTAECSHAFHFPCISSHVRTQGCLVCPVCSTTWQEVPLLSSSLHLHSPAAGLPQQQQQQQQQQHQMLGGKGPRRERSNSNSSRGRREGERAARAGITKIYDDDESLQLSPSSRLPGGVLQFNPIPEESEAEEEDDEEEGQGDDEYCDQREQGGDHTKAISVIPDSIALVSTGRNHLSYVVSIKVKAPPLPPGPHSSSINKHDVAAAPVVMPPSLLDHPSCRAPIDLVTVLDVSGSMTVVKLQMLKRAMRLVISSLGPGDRLSIVAFSMAAAKRLLPLSRMSRAGQRSARQIVDRLVICGSSQAQAQAQAQAQSHHCSSTFCVGDALRKATKVLEDRRERNPVATIMLLSDGHRHGQGQQQEEEQNVYGTTTCSRRSQNHQTSSVTRFTHIEIPIHASEGFRGVQQQQKQSTTSLKNNDNNMPVMEEGENVFANCVNGLVTVVLQDVNLQFTFPSATSAQCGEISSVYSYSYPYGDGGIGQGVSHGGGGKFILLGDLYAEEERQLLVELKVPKVTLVRGEAPSISVMCNYRDPLTRDMIHCGERPLVMPIPMPMSLQPPNETHPMQLLLSPSTSSSSTATSLSTQQQQQQLRNLFVTTRAMVESRRLVELSDLDTALHLLSSARSLLLLQSTAVSNTHKKLVLSLEAQLEDLQRQQQQQQRRQQQQQPPQSLSPSQRRRSDQPLLGEARGGGGGEPLTPTSAWRAAEQLAKVAIMRKSLSRVSDLHGLENARF